MRYREEQDTEDRREGRDASRTVNPIVGIGMGLAMVIGSAMYNPYTAVQAGGYCCAIENTPCWKGTWDRQCGYGCHASQGCCPDPLGIGCFGC